MLEPSKEFKDKGYEIFCVGDDIEVMKPDGENIAVTVAAIENEDHVFQQSAPHACQLLYVTLEDKTGSSGWAEGELLRMKPADGAKR